MVWFDCTPEINRYNWRKRQNMVTNSYYKEVTNEKTKGIRLFWGLVLTIILNMGCFPIGVLAENQADQGNLDTNYCLLFRPGL